MKFLPTRWGLNIFEGLLVLAGFVTLMFAIQHLWPSSGFAQAIHAGFHVIAVALFWVATGLNNLGLLLNQV